MSEDGTARILIVDDEPIGIEIVAQALGPEFACTFALSGPDALTALETGELPALILLDVMMPGMDGYQLCRWLKAEPRTREIPVIFITAANDIESETSALLAGAADFIHKPVTPQVLRLRVGMQILLREREQTLRWLNAGLEQRVSERTRALSEALSRAEAANHAKTRFLANMSGEIRAPLADMVGLLGRLHEEETARPLQGQIADVLVIANTLSRVLGDILELADIETDRVLLNPREFAPYELYERLYTAIAPLAAAKNLALRFALDALPSGLRGDLDRLSQLLIHLLDNAVKFTTEGSVTLRARVAGEAGNRVRLAFTVVDTGCGVPAEVQQQIFLPFEQPEHTGTHRHIGTGLGLAIARQLAGLMNGWLRLAGSDATGSTFIAEVWLERVAQPATDPLPLPP
ncbi:response regulator [uncultured Thiodictyon sp.]|uniref:hybrid sensor histidine kinase/response regulator n=1 Tax=uncultured Thiodictyon sp. TaxID=1846217 RepID=UPI0025CC5F9E|nr:response regulator [uncultured Thiodictyon sp.]